MERFYELEWTLYNNTLFNNSINGNIVLPLRYTCNCNDIESSFLLKYNWQMRLEETSSRRIHSPANRVLSKFYC